VDLLVTERALGQGFALGLTGPRRRNGAGPVGDRHAGRTHRDLPGDTLNDRGLLDLGEIVRSFFLGQERREVALTGVAGSGDCNTSHWWLSPYQVGTLTHRGLAPTACASML